jgi:hypothetical protein
MTDPCNKTTADDILVRIEDLHKQATTEKSHYYTASTLAACSQEIVRLRAALTLIASCDSHHAEDVVAIARKVLS